MKKTTIVRNALFWIAAMGISSNSSAFIDPDEWKMGKWDEWDGPPDMKKWRTDQWGDMDQWGMMPDSDRRLPWEMRSGSMPWKGNNNWGNMGNMPWGGNRGGMGSMPWGGNRSGWGNNMPWGGNNYGTPPWRGNNRWGPMPWGGPQSGWAQPSPYYGPQPPQTQGWRGEYTQPAPQQRRTEQPYRAEPGRYPLRPEGSKPATTEAAPPAEQTQ